MKKIKRGRPKAKFRKYCIVCETNMESGRCSQGTPKSVRYLTCSKKCSKRFARIKIYVTINYIRRIKKLEEDLKRK